MSIGPTLTTARLILRPPQHEDFDGFASMAQEEDTMRFIGGVAPRDAAWRGMATLRARGRCSATACSPCSKRDRRMDRPARPLASGRQGRRMAGRRSRLGREARRAMGRATPRRRHRRDRLGVRHLGWDHVIHCIAENTPSITLAERLGSRDCARATSSPRSKTTRSTSTASRKQEWRRTQKAVTRKP